MTEVTRFEVGKIAAAPAGMIPFWTACDIVRIAWFGIDSIQIAPTTWNRYSRLCDLINQRRWSSIGPSSRPGALRRGLFGAGSGGLVGLAYEPSREAQLATRKLERAEARRVALNVRIELMLSQINEGRDFLRAQCAAELLRCIVIDPHGTIRHARTRAWLNEANWNSFLKELIFESGNEPLEPRGRPFFFREDIEALANDLSFCSLLRGPDGPRLVHQVVRTAAPPIASGKVRRLSAAGWFAESGRTAAVASLKARGGRISEGGICREAAMLWNAEHPARSITPSALAKAAQRKRNKNQAGVKSS